MTGILDWAGVPAPSWLSPFVLPCGLEMLDLGSGILLVVVPGILCRLLITALTLNIHYFRIRIFRGFLTE